MQSNGVPRLIENKLDGTEIETEFRSLESDSRLQVPIQKLATSELPEDSANQNVGIKDNHLNGPQFFEGVV
jgi:hypothetical protein